MDCALVGELIEGWLEYDNNCQHFVGDFVAPLDLNNLINVLVLMMKHNVIRI